MFSVKVHGKKKYVNLHKKLCALVATNNGSKFTSHLSVNLLMTVGKFIGAFRVKLPEFSCKITCEISRT